MHRLREADVADGRPIDESSPNFCVSSAVGRWSAITSNSTSR